MQTLLDKIGVIDFTYQKIRDKDRFNIFSLLRKISDEEHLHSKFIHELLNPKGTHGQGTVFLEQFLEVIGIKIESFDRASIYTSKEWMKIDILIRFDNEEAVIIENKIWADDQSEQLQRYYDKVNKMGFKKIHVIYLTPYGHPPSKNSLGNLKLTDVSIISYKLQIKDWIEKCIAQSATKPALRETLVQYQNIIKQITGQTMNAMEKGKIIELLKHGENISYAKKIIEIWSDVKFHVEWNFWQEFSEKIESNGYIILERQRLKADDVKKDKSNVGLMFEFFKPKDEQDQICLYIQRDKGEYLYYGLTAVSNGKRANSQAKYAKYSDIIDDIWGNGERNEWWLGSKSFKWNNECIYFSSFSTKATTDLIKDDIRKIFVDALWKEIEEFIKNFNERRTK